MAKKIKRKEIREEIIIPDGIHVKVDREMIKISKGNESLEKKTSYPVSVKEGKVIIEDKKPTKNQKKMIKTTASHIRNMINGLEKKYVYKLQSASVHFPMSVSVHGKELIIKNFLGEVKDRKAVILDAVNVKVDKDIITVESSDKEKAGQTAANIEKAARIRKKDRRIFQDGIFIIEKQKGARK